MKRMMMQILRLAMTMIIMGTMAVMIFSLRDEVASLKRRLENQASTIAFSAQIVKDDPGVFATIQSRTSIRTFDPSKAVSDEAIEKILKAGVCAPSAMNKQPWEFVVVRDAAKLKAIGDALPYSRVGNGAQAAIVVCGNLDNGLPGSGKEYWIQDCSAASMNILLAAKALGLGAVWTGVYPGEDRVAAVRKILAIPEGYMPLNVIPIGYPAESSEPKDKWNAVKIHRDGWLARGLL